MTKREPEQQNGGRKTPVWIPTMRFSRRTRTDNPCQPAALRTHAFPVLGASERRQARPSIFPVDLSSLRNELNLLQVAVVAGRKLSQQILESVCLQHLFFFFPFYFNPVSAIDCFCGCRIPA
jgi:hypothetical protein